MRDSVKPRSVYLDYAAATPLDSSVADVICETLRTVYGNAGSVYQVGRQAFDLLEAARQTVADALNVAPREVLFTASGTESDNLAILGLARAHKHRGSHVVISAIEHKAVLAAAEALEREGFLVTRVLPDEYGVVSAVAVAAACTPQTILVSVMYANNEIGTIEPIAEISNELKMVRDDGFTPLFHTDACQAPGQLPVFPRQLGVTAMTLNSAKVYGPKGVGILYLAAGTAMAPLIVGGRQENGYRAGTENVPLIVGAAEAFRLAFSEQKREAERLFALRQYFASQLQKELPQALLNGHPTNRLPNNLHYCIPDIEGESLLLLLDQAGIAVATGSACSSGDLEPSHVLTAIGRSEEIIHGSIRLTMGRATTKDDVDYTIAVLAHSVERLQSFSASGITRKNI